MQARLRQYQTDAVQALYAWFRSNKSGYPCIEMPTGSGKSHVIAAICRDAVTQWPDTKILMLTHVKELIEQNAEKMIHHWEDAPLGIFSAGMRQKTLGMPITFASIQSIRDRSEDLGHVDLILIDECHLVSHKHQGSYRNLIEKLTTINPTLRVIGLTATPYRLGHGLITDEPAIFSDIITPVSIEELIHKKFLAPLRSKLTKHQLNVKGVHRRGGEFIEAELQAAVNIHSENVTVVDEVINFAEDRKSWLFFCSGIDHAKNIRDLLKDRGIAAETVTGKTSKKDRETIIRDFKSGKIKALTNANVLTTGFDHPDLDLIAMLRPTLSPGLYVQMAGRGLRPKTHTDHCLVLDFAGVVQTHGPIIAVNPPRKHRAADGECPMKACPECHELNVLSARFCVAPDCGHEFVSEQKFSNLKLRQDDIMGAGKNELKVSSWLWRKHTSQASGKDMITVTYYDALGSHSVIEYLTVFHEGYSGQKAKETLASMINNSGAAKLEGSMEECLQILNKATPPTCVKYTKDGRFFRVRHRKWGSAHEDRA